MHDISYALSSGLAEIVCGPMLLCHPLGNALYDAAYTTIANLQNVHSDDWDSIIYIKLLLETQSIIRSDWDSIIYIKHLLET